MEQYILLILSFMMINIILATSLNLINGITGQFSLGHAGFMALGAYVSAVVTKYPIDIIKSILKDNPEGLATLNSYIWIYILFGVLLGGIVAGIVGILFGIPVLRLRGDYLAIVTLGFGEIIRVVIQNLEITGGARGLPGVPGLKGFSGLFICFVIMMIVVIIIRNIMHSSEGRALLAIRENDIAAEAMGVDVTRYKIMAFGLSAFFAGIAGGLFGHIYQFLQPGNFNIYKTVDIFLMVVLGGMGSLSGSVIGAIILTIVPELLRGFAAYRMLVYSLVLIILMISRPNGILGKQELTDVISFKKRGV